MRYCSVCGFVLGDDIRFCPGCGTPASSERPAVPDSGTEDTGPVITAEIIFNTTKQELSDLFSYSRLGKEFTGDISFVRDRVRRTVSGTPAETLRSIADSNMADVRRRLSQIDDGINDRNWGNIDFNVAKTFLEERGGMSVPMRKVKIKAYKLVKDFILFGGIDYNCKQE